MVERTGTAEAAPPLSARESEIARLYALGKTSREIAGELCISQTTVRNHVATIYRKLGVGNKAELAGALNDAGETGPANNRTPGTPTRAAERELADARAQQLAINEVLRVISHSPGDLEAIFDVILDYALELSRSQLGIVYLHAEGGFRPTAFKNVPPGFKAYLQGETLDPDPATGLGRMAKQRRIIHIHDVRTEDLYSQGEPLRVATADLGGARSFLAIPMIHRDALIGAFTIYRREVKPFVDGELSLLQAFSDQAAIALTITRLIGQRDELQQKLNDRYRTIPAGAT